jgi:hypothetical protein
MNVEAGSQPGSPSVKIGNVLLLILGASTVLIAPLFPDSMYKPVYGFHITAIMLAAVLALKRDRLPILAGALATSAIDITATITSNNALLALGRGLNVLFFAFIVVMLITSIARTKRVSLLVIMSAINGYLLLGLALGFVAAIIAIYDPAAYSFAADGSPLGETMYYAFITFTTVGYGDFLPAGKLARSLAVLTGFSGQLYVAIVIALLVGKFAATSGGKK